MTDQLTRRELLKRGAAGSALLTVPGLLAACGGKAKSSSAGKSAHKLAKTLHFSNWTLYMDTNKKKHIFPSLVEFQKKYGVHVDYVEEINDNASFFGKIQGQLSRGQSVHRDIVVLNDRPGTVPLGPGDRLTLSWDPEATFVVDSLEGSA